MPTVHVLSGLPGSGKTTHSFRLVDASEKPMVRTSLDDIRDMIGIAPDRSAPGTERMVKTLENAMIRAAVKTGRDVVIDNCNLNAAGPLRIKKAVEGIEDITFVVHDFTHRSLRVCVERDATRTNGDPVGEVVIRRLYSQLAKARQQGWKLTNEWMNTPYAPVPGKE